MAERAIAHKPTLHKTNVLFIQDYFVYFIFIHFQTVFLWIDLSPANQAGGLCANYGPSATFLIASIKSLNLDFVQ